MKTCISQGYGSEFIVLNASTKEVVSDVLLLFPLKDREALKVLQEHVSSGQADYELLKACERYEQVWDGIDEAKGDK